MLNAHIAQKAEEENAVEKEKKNMRAMMLMLMLVL